MLIDGAIVSFWCHPRSVSSLQPPSCAGLLTVPLGMLPLYLIIPAPTSAKKPLPRKVLLPKRAVTPLLDGALVTGAGAVPSDLWGTQPPRLVKAGEALLGGARLREEDNPVDWETYQAILAVAAWENYAPRALVRRYGDGDQTAFAAVRL